MWHLSGGIALFVAVNQKICRSDFLLVSVLAKMPACLLLRMCVAIMHLQGKWCGRVEFEQGRQDEFFG